jgi:signal transduction histidine kinase
MGIARVVGAGYICEIKSLYPNSKSLSMNTQTSYLPLQHQGTFFMSVNGQTANPTNNIATLCLTAAQIQEQERIKLGHELHDDVNSTLAAAKLYLQIAAENSKDGKKIMSLALTAIKDAMDTIRNISANMVVAQNSDFDVVSGTKKFLKTFAPANIFKISCRFSKDFEKCNLSKDKQICLYRIVQEQMNNIIKYSHAKNIAINLTCLQNTCILMIKDDGVGCDDCTAPAGIGLMNIANRVAQLHGQVSIITSQGSGFALKVILPIY